MNRSRPPSETLEIRSSRAGREIPPRVTHGGLWAQMRNLSRGYFSLRRSRALSGPREGDGAERLDKQPAAAQTSLKIFI